MKNKVMRVLALLFIFLTLSCSDTKITDPGENGTVFPIIKSSVNGDNWKLIASLPTSNGVNSCRLTDISCDSDGNVYVSNSGNGIYKIANNDYSVTKIVNGLIPITSSGVTTYFTGAIIFNDDRIIAGASDLIVKGGIFTMDKDVVQSRVQWDKYSNVVSFFKNLTGEIYAGCYYDLLSSTDNGNTWQNLTDKTESGFAYFYSFCPDKYGNIYGATRKGVYYSEVGRNNFKSIALTNETILGIGINSKDWIYASTENSKMFVSKDHGSTWLQLSNYPLHQAHCIYINKNDYILVATEDGIYRSKDNGESWESVGIKNKWVLKIIPLDNGNLIAGTYMNEIYCCTQ